MNIQANLFDTSKFLEEKTEYKLTDPAWDIIEEKNFDIGQRLYFGNVENQCILISKNPYKVRLWNGVESTQNDLKHFEDATHIKRILMVGDLIKVDIEAKVNKRQIHLICTKGVVIEFLPKNKVLINFQKLPLGPETHKLCLKSLTLVRGWEQDSRLRAYNSEDLKSLDSAKSMNTAAIASPNSTQEFTTTATSNQSPMKENLNQENLTSSQHHLPVSHSAFKENAKQQKTSETVSLQSSELLETTNRDMSALKTLQDFSLVPITQTPIENTSGTYLVDYPQAGTMQNGHVFQADTLQAPLIENDYCWLPAPTALSTKNSRPPGLSKLETFLKQKGLISKGEVLDPVILSEWFGIPTSWLDPLESLTAIQILENSAAQQEIFSTPELQQLHSEELSISNLAPDKSCPQCGAWLNPHINICNVCDWKPENFLEEIEKTKKRSQPKKRRNKRGSLYKYLENKKLKDGRVTSYPRITSNFRDPENPHHWRWGYHWDEKIDGKWKGRSIGSIPPGVIGYIKDMRSRNVQIEEIISFIKKAKRKK